MYDVCRCIDVYYILQDVLREEGGNAEFIGTVKTIRFDKLENYSRFGFKNRLVPAAEIDVLVIIEKIE